MLVLLALAGTAQADTPWHLDLAWRTDVPILMGGMLGLEMPGRVRAALTLGAIPRSYLDLINNTALRQEWYDEETADLVDASLQGSVVFRPELGWRPFPKLGFNFAAGYQLIGLGGSVSSVDLFETFTDIKVPPRIQEVAEDLDVSATLHLLTVRTGWDFVVAKRLVIGLSLGGAFTVGSRQTVETPELDLSDRPFLEAAAAEVLQEVSEEGEDRLGEVFRKHVHTPVIAIYVGGRLF